jgi:hypothetical protein
LRCGRWRRAHADIKGAVRVASAVNDEMKRSNGTLVDEMKRGSGDKP